MGSYFVVFFIDCLLADVLRAVFLGAAFLAVPFIPIGLAFLAGRLRVDGLTAA
jgi:hypothetical protein